MNATKAVTTDETREYLNEIKRIVERIKGDQSFPTKSVPIAGVYNSAVFVIEILGLYIRIWDELKRPKTLEDEDAERLMKMGQWLFILTFSDIEYCIRRCLDVSDGELSTWYAQNKRRRINFNSIIDKCMHQDKDVWKRLSNIRNLIVHNGAIAERNGDLELGPVTIKKTEGKPIRVHFNILIILSLELVKLFDSWQQWFFKNKKMIQVRLHP